LVEALFFLHLHSDHSFQNNGTTEPKVSALKRLLAQRLCLPRASHLELCLLLSSPTDDYDEEDDEKTHAGPVVVVLDDALTLADVVTELWPAGGDVSEELIFYYCLRGLGAAALWAEAAGQGGEERGGGGAAAAAAAAMEEEGWVPDVYRWDVLSIVEMVWIDMKTKIKERQKSMKESIESQEIFMFTNGKKRLNEWIDRFRLGFVSILSAHKYKL
jgi:hypothetical protein